MVWQVLGSKRQLNRVKGEHCEDGEDGEEDDEDGEDGEDDCQHVGTNVLVPHIAPSQ